jgi:DnaJ-class molecular chaperone
MSEPIVGYSNDGYYECPDCKGVGTFEQKSETPWEFSMAFSCHRCSGKGKIDWVSYVIKPVRTFIGAS